MNNWTRKSLKISAKAGLKQNYWKAVAAGLIGGIMCGGISGISQLTSIGGRAKVVSAEDLEEIRSIISRVPQSQMMAVGLSATALLICVCIAAYALHAFVFAPMEVGCDRFFQKNLNEEAKLGELLHGYKNNYLHNVKTLFVRDIFVLLWSMLFFIPGIIKAYEYRMVPYILNDHPEMTTKEVFAMSKDMMRGNKWDAFVLDFSFILWDILGVFTFGILNLLFVNPYKRMTSAGLYQELKAA